MCTVATVDRVFWARAQQDLTSRANRSNRNCRGPVVYFLLRRNLARRLLQVSDSRASCIAPVAPWREASVAQLSFGLVCSPRLECLHLSARSVRWACPLPPGCFALPGYFHQEWPVVRGFAPIT